MMKSKNSVSATTVNSDESKTLCGVCGTELVQNSDCATVNTTWCPKCKRYPTSAVVAGCWVSINTPLVAIPQIECEQMKCTIEKQKQEIEQLKAFTPQHGECIYEAEQIRIIMAQNYAMKEALKQAREAIVDLMSCNEYSKSADWQGEEAVKAIEKLLQEESK